MKIRKGLMILFYVLLLAASLWILRRIGSSEYDSQSRTETTESQEYGETRPDSEISGAGAEEAARNPVDWERLWRELENMVRYIACRQGEAGIFQRARRRREQEAREKACQSWGFGQENVMEIPEPPYVPPKIMIASDLHFMSHTTHDNGEAFQKMVAGDDGKVSQYSDIIIDALLEEAFRMRPSALVLAGDNTLNGERVNQEELAQKLQRLADDGITVLIIPGNHDIQNHSAATYFGEKREEAEYLENAEDFLEIFHFAGYDQALSRDPASLSYVYALDDTHWMMMLDSCQYENGNQVNGRIRQETLVWMRELLVLAQEKGVSVVPVAHHNLLSESRLYTTECTMENHGEVVGLLEEFELPVYFSGHLHAQRIKKHKAAPGTAEEAYGVTEIVLSPFSIPPCQYGILEWKEDGGMVFETRTADVAAGKTAFQKTAQKPLPAEQLTGPDAEPGKSESGESGPEKAVPEKPELGEAVPEESEPEESESGKSVPEEAVPEKPEPEESASEKLKPEELEPEEPRGAGLELTEEDREFLDNFSVHGEEFVRKIREDQVKKTLYSAPDDLKEQMSRLYASVYYDYCAGNRMAWNEVSTTKAFKLWERLYPDSSYIAEMRRMVEDVREDHHDWEK